MHSSDLHWLAGWLEGEGSFGLYQQGPALQVASTDEDVVRMAAKILNTGVNGPYDDNRGNNNRKLFWKIHVHGERAAELMRTLLPYMRGQRRIVKITQILERWSVFTK